jgi:predicted DNA-binding transcriptional regulator YafY
MQALFIRTWRQNMKIDRLLGIITVLINKERVTAPYLAEKFEVSRRTIKRDIEDICKAGIPIVTIQGNNGGISIEEGYKIDKNLLKKDELNAILTGLKSIDSVAGDRSNRAIIEKLSGKSDEKNSEFMRIDLASYYKDSLSYKIDCLKEAVTSHVEIQFLYYSIKGESLRTVEPYYVTYKWSSWYLFGYCLNNGDFRLFKLNRMTELLITKDAYTVRVLPEDKKMEEYFPPNYYLEVLFDVSVKFRLVEEYGVGSFEIMEDQRLLFKRNFTNLDYMLQWIFSFSDKAEVLAPLEIRELVKERAELLVKKYS